MVCSISLLACANSVWAQLSVDADLRARMELRNGYGTLRSESDEAAAFVTQRTRLVFDYGNKNLKLRVSPQNVRVWGDVATTSKTDYNGTMLHEAYGEAILGPRFSARLGRQELNYDDARILGNVDWAMQGRSHDALLLKFTSDSTGRHSVHLGLALNANKESNFKEDYAQAQYKAMQFLWYHGKFNDLGVSFLFLNNGMPYTSTGGQKIAYSQTVGPRLTFAKDAWKADASFYAQLGKVATKDVSAFYAAGNVGYKASDQLQLSLGMEYLSGTDARGSADLKSFTPYYGTNHKFNGFMDYFYVGNHLGSVGLMDLNATLAYQKAKFSASLTPHYFASAASIYRANTTDLDNYLGTELDFTLGYKLMENVKLAAGYSQMFASPTLEDIKGGDKDLSNNWFYLSLAFSPKLLSTKAKD